MSAVERTALSLMEMIIGMHRAGASSKDSADRIMRQLKSSGISLVSTAKLEVLQNDQRITRLTK